MLVSCNAKNKEAYEKKDVKITYPYKNKEEKKDEKIQEFQINGIYPVKKDTYMYSEKKDEKSFEKLEENSYIKIILEEEDGYIFVDYNGNKGYIKTEKIKIDQ